MASSQLGCQPILKIQRLAYRSSGWIEIVDEGESYVSGMITYTNPDVSHREAFLWLKKEDVFVPQQELMNTPEDLAKASACAIGTRSIHEDEQYPCLAYRSRIYTCHTHGIRCGDDDRIQYDLRG